MGMTSGVKKVVAGGSTTCAITDANALKCWGNNYHGQVGDGTTINRIFPVNVTGMSSDVIDVSTGGFHTCAIKSDHKVYCWGWNGLGELGDGTQDQHLTPVQVINLSGAEKIAVGQERSCALLDTGGVKCWGNYPLGNNDDTVQYSTTPLDVFGFTSGAGAIEGGGQNTCLLTTGNGAKCWGYYVGNGTGTYVNSPQQVYEMESGVNQISAGESQTTCAIVTGGALKCWGFNEQGQVGNGNQTDQHYPVAVQGLSSGVTQVSVGGVHTCAIVSGVLKCWGNNFVGSLGNNSYSNSNVPVNVVWTQ